MTPVTGFPRENAVLSGGTRMPLLGFGTWQLTGSQARDAVGWALEAGYRHLDTATVYRNEAEVGAALRDSGVARDEVFVTTKCPPTNAGRELDTLRASLDALDIDAVDLWLIHWPPRAGTGTDLWRPFVQAREKGLARAIGVSNHSLDQIDQLTAATGVTPAVNQVEWSPLLFDAAMLAGSTERGVVLEGYSALRGGTLEHPKVRGIADSVGRTPAQVIVRWHLQHGVLVIPKSGRRERIESNADVGAFTLSPEQMATLDDLGG